MVRNTNGFNYREIASQLRREGNEGGINGVRIIPRSRVEQKMRTRKAC